MKSLQCNTSIQFKNTPDNSQFDIHTIQWRKENSEYENIVAKSSNYFQIIWIIKGEGNFYIDLHRYNFKNGQMFFIRPGQLYRIESADALEGYAISFTELFFGLEGLDINMNYPANIFQIFANANGIRIDNELALKMTDFMKCMMKEITNIHLLRDEMLRCYFKIFLIHLSGEMKNILQITSQTRNKELVQKFMLMVDRHFKTEKMVSGYAGMLLVTPNYLNEIIKKTTGYSAGYHIRQRIVLEAKRQATYSGSCMKQIGYYLGFNDMAHFSKYFKNVTGMSFTDFKKEKLVISIFS